MQRGDTSEWVSELVLALETENEHLRTKVEELELAKTHLEEKVDRLQEQNQQLQSVIDDLQGTVTVQPTHRNICYGEEKKKKRLPIFSWPVRGAQEVGSLSFGECFAVRGQQKTGQDLWLQIRGGDNADQWVLGRDEGTVNCVDMTKYDREKYRTRIHSSEYSGQDFPQRMYTEGFAGSNWNHLCLISASGDSLWRELNIEMLLRGIATATVFERAWGGDETFTDWVAYYAVNCVQYGQLWSPLHKRLLVTVKPTSRWREYQAGCCRGPDLDKLRDDIGKAQYKECFWLKGMEDQLHVTWGEVEFLTGFAFLRTHCAWTADDCKRAANERFIWVLEEFFAGGVKEKASYELERAHWLWDEAFDGCRFEKAPRSMAYNELQRLAKLGGGRFELPRSLSAASTAAPLAWVELAAAAVEAADAAAATAATTSLASHVAAMDGAGHLAAGGSHSALLDAVGTLHVWGANSDGQSLPPTLAPGESWVAVCAGGYHTLGLTAAGVLRAWGSNLFDQCSAPSLRHHERWVAVSAGLSHSLGLTTRGALHAWGDNSAGQCTVPVLPSGERWAAARAGVGCHSLGLTVSGVLYAWGQDDAGQCRRVPVLPEGQRWVSVSAGGHHCLALTAAGELYAWGANSHGQCSGVPVLAPGECWLAVSAGGNHSLGLTSVGSLYAWGSREQGQADVPQGKQWLAACAGQFHNLGLTSGGVVCAWGRDSDGQVSRVPCVPGTA